MKKLIYKVKLFGIIRGDGEWNAPGAGSDFRPVIGVYDDGTHEFLDCTEEERKKKEETLVKLMSTPGIIIMHSSLEGSYNPRHPKAFETYVRICCATGNMPEGFGSGFTEYFGEGDPWEPDPQFENCVF